MPKDLILVCKIYFHVLENKAAYAYAVSECALICVGWYFRFIQKSRNLSLGSVKIKRFWIRDIYYLLRYVCHGESYCKLIHIRIVNIKNITHAR